MRWTRVVNLVGAALVACAGAGCVGGSLATNSGPRSAGSRWSAAANQKIHVGETVEFDFVLHDAWQRFVRPGGIADYCVLQIGDKRVEAIPGPYGHFDFTHTFEDVAPGAVIDVKVEAFRQRGAKDFVEIGELWMPTEAFSRDPDASVCRDKIRLTAYQSAVSFQVARPADDFDPATGVLRLRKPDGKTTSVYVNRPTRRGFILDGPEPAGYYRVRYQPRGFEVAHTGTTAVTFTIYDVGGQRHVTQLELDTP